MELSHSDNDIDNSEDDVNYNPELDVGLDDEDINVEQLTDDDNITAMVTTVWQPKRVIEKKKPQRKYVTGQLRSDGRVYFICAGSEGERAVTQSTAPSRPLKKKLMDATILKNHWNSIHCNKKTKMLLVDSDLCLARKFKAP